MYGQTTFPKNVPNGRILIDFFYLTRSFVTEVYEFLKLTIFIEFMELALSAKNITLYSAQVFPSG